MKNADYWEVFELTGSINDYLNYACASEERQEMGKEEGGQAGESGDCLGNGFVGHASGGI